VAGIGRTLVPIVARHLNVPRARTHRLIAAPWRNSVPEELLELAREAQAIRRQLDLPPMGPGDLFLQACAESANVDDQHRLGPRRLAERLLKALDASHGG
jgi:hypothetical protein